MFYVFLESMVLTNNYGGWKIQLEKTSENDLKIIHYNIPPNGEEYVGIEIEYSKI